MGGMYQFKMFLLKSKSRGHYDIQKSHITSAYFHFTMLMTLIVLDNRRNVNAPEKSNGP